MEPTVNQTHRASPDLHTLVDLFYESMVDLGTFEEVDAASMPDVFRKLLVHDEHMTVTVEAHHNSPVDVEVLRTRATETHYSRKIRLARRSDGQVVQFGIVRLNLDYLGPDARQEIESQQTPLGRILIEHNILRTVKLLSLWKITPSEDLCNLFSLQNPATCYGRTALIYCNGVIAVELLEIVTPV